MAQKRVKGLRCRLHFLDRNVVVNHKNFPFSTFGSNLLFSTFGSNLFLQPGAVAGGAKDENTPLSFSGGGHCPPLSIFDQNVHRLIEFSRVAAV